MSVCLYQRICKIGRSSWLPSESSRRIVSKQLSQKLKFRQESLKLESRPMAQGPYRLKWPDKSRLSAVKTKVRVINIYFSQDQIILEQTESKQKQKYDRTHGKGKFSLMHDGVRRKLDKNRTMIGYWQTWKRLSMKVEIVRIKTEASTSHDIQRKLLPLAGQFPGHRKRW